ncbi:MAG: hypothetical protein OSJ70_07540 [Bacilli bacterium]|nr:hypothetical protein [Bacilli bacterium]
MNIEGNVYISYLEELGFQRIVGVRPSSKLRKERDKKRGNRHNQGCYIGVSFNECLSKRVEELNNTEDYEEERPKRLLK